MSARGINGVPMQCKWRLATNRVGTPGRDGAEIVSQNVINAQEAAAKAAEGLSMRCAGSGTPPHRGKGARKRTDGTC